MIEDELLKAANVLMDRIAYLPGRELSVHDSQKTCINACKAHSTDICLTLTFATEKEKKGFAKLNDMGSPDKSADEDVMLYDKVNTNSNKRFSRNVFDQSTELESVTQADKDLQKEIEIYMKSSKDLESLVKKQRKGVDSEYLNFIAVPYRKPTEFEKKLYNEFTTASCLEAEDSSRRHE